MIDVKHAGGNEYEVTVSTGGSSSTHTVTLDDNYYRRLAKDGESKESLIERSFDFLLKRESKESILRSFDLPIIGRYFPEYEESISA